MKPKRNFLKLYDATVDDVFSYYYERTYDRGKSIELTREHFTKRWDTVLSGKTHTLRSASVSESSDYDIAPKSSPDLDSLRLNFN